MADVLVDVTRLLGRLLKGRLATGVDRVDLAYVEHFAARARAVVHLSGRHSVLSKRASERVFARLIAQRESLAAGVLPEVAAGVAAGLAEAVPAGAVYLNTGHSGLTRPHALHRLRSRGLQPVFRALLFPSFVEGYGLPLLEALQAGTPVIASDLPVFREIAGRIPAYVDPLDGPTWLVQIEDYASSASTARAAQKSRMAGFAAPTWAQHFAAVDEIIAGLHAQAPRAAALETA